MWRREIKKLNYNSVNLFRFVTQNLLYNPFFNLHKDSNVERRGQGGCIIGDLVISAVSKPQLNNNGLVYVNSEIFLNDVDECC